MRFAGVKRIASKVDPRKTSVEVCRLGGHNYFGGMALWFIEFINAELSWRRFSEISFLQYFPIFCRFLGSKLGMVLKPLYQANYLRRHR